jgi:hypothetical protein
MKNNFYFPHMARPDFGPIAPGSPACFYFLFVSFLKSAQPGPHGPVIPFLPSWPKPAKGHPAACAALNRSPSAPLPPQPSHTGADPLVPLPCRSLFNFEEPSPLTDSTRRRPVTSLVRSSLAVPALQKTP